MRAEVTALRATVEILQRAIISGQQMQLSAHAGQQIQLSPHAGLHVMPPAHALTSHPAQAFFAAMAAQQQMGTQGPRYPL